MVWNENVEAILRLALTRMKAHDIEASLFHLRNLFEMIDENQRYLDAGYSLHELLGDMVQHESDEFTRSVTGENDDGND